MFSAEKLSRATVVPTHYVQRNMVKISSNPNSPCSVKMMKITILVNMIKINSNPDSLFQSK